MIVWFNSGILKEFIVKIVELVGEFFHKCSCLLFEVALIILSESNLPFELDLQSFFQKSINFRRLSILELIQVIQTVVAEHDCSFIDLVKEGLREFL